MSFKMIFRKCPRWTRQMGRVDRAKALQPVLLPVIAHAVLPAAKKVNLISSWTLACRRIPHLLMPAGMVRMSLKRMLQNVGELCIAMWSSTTWCRCRWVMTRWPLTLHFFANTWFNLWIEGTPCGSDDYGRGWKEIHFVAGNPTVEITNGIIHLFKEKCVFPPLFLFSTEEIANLCYYQKFP